MARGVRIFVEPFRQEGSSKSLGLKRNGVSTHRNAAYKPLNFFSFRTGAGSVCLTLDTRHRSDGSYSLGAQSHSVATTVTPNCWSTEEEATEMKCSIGAPRAILPALLLILV